MSRVLIIGAGGVGGVVTHKCAQVPEVFSEITLASRTLSKCEAIRDQISRPIDVAQVDADDPKQVVALINKVKPKLLINVATGGRISLNDLFRTLRTIIGGTLEPEYDEFRAGDVRHIVASPIRARDELEFSAQTSFHSGMKELASAPLRQ